MIFQQIFFECCQPLEQGELVACIFVARVRPRISKGIIDLLFPKLLLVSPSKKLRRMTNHTQLFRSHSCKEYMVVVVDVYNLRDKNVIIYGK